MQIKIYSARWLWLHDCYNWRIFSSSNILPWHFQGHWLAFRIEIVYDTKVQIRQALFASIIFKLCGTRRRKRTRIVQSWYSLFGHNSLAPSWKDASCHAMLVLTRRSSCASAVIILEPLWPLCSSLCRKKGLERNDYSIKPSIEWHYRTGRESKSVLLRVSSNPDKSAINHAFIFHVWIFPLS